MTSPGNWQHRRLRQRGSEGSPVGWERNTLTGVADCLGVEKRARYSWSVKRMSVITASTLPSCHSLGTDFAV